MSRAPDKGGVEFLRQNLKDLRYICGRVAELKKLLAELPKLEQEAEEKHAEVLKSLESMDLKSSGNMGWENRMVWFLNELDAQAANDPS